MTIYTTSPETCVIGCGEPLLFVCSSINHKVFLCCPSCQGIWNKSLFREIEITRNPRLYAARDFKDNGLMIPSIEVIQSVWEGDVRSAEPARVDFYLDRLRAMLGGKLTGLPPP